jgi:hypothetical protein
LPSFFNSIIIGKKIPATKPTECSKPLFNDAPLEEENNPAAMPKKIIKMNMMMLIKIISPIESLIPVIDMENPSSILLKRRGINEKSNRYMVYPVKPRAIAEKP